MSSSDRGRRSIRRLGTIGVAAIAFALGACSVQPLYGPASFSDSGTVQATLTRISVGQVTTKPWA